MSTSVSGCLPVRDCVCTECLRVCGEDDDDNDDATDDNDNGNDNSNGNDDDDDGDAAGAGPLLAVSQARILRSKERPVTGCRVNCLIASDKYARPPRRNGGREHVPRKDAIAVGVRLAARIVVAEQLVRDKRSEFKEYKKAAEFVRPPLSHGWARKPPRGETFGATYIHDFQDQIVLLYQRGNKDKNAKVSLAQVAEILKRENPHRFRLPRSWAVQNAFNALGQNKANPQRRRRKGLQPEVRNFVSNLVNNEPTITAKPALQKVLQQFPELDDSMKNPVRNLVNSLKTKKRQGVDRL